MGPAQRAIGRARTGISAVRAANHRNYRLPGGPLRALTTVVLLLSAVACAGKGADGPANEKSGRVPPGGEAGRAMAALFAGQAGDGDFEGPIVLDPGHGGEDTGAVVSGSIRESEVVLAVTLKTRDILKERAPELPVLLTRESDEFVALQGRMSLANQQRARLFVSIHANAAQRAGARGVETYLLSPEASDDESRKIALIENAALKFEGASPDDPLLITLLSLASADQIRQSEEFAGITQTRLADDLKTMNRGIKQAPFFVLSRAQMPAILVEIGFVTNPRERDRLLSPEYQEQIASALASAIIEFEKHRAAQLRAMEGEPRKPLP